MSPRGARTGRASGGRSARAGATDPQASATNGLEAKLWASADMLRNNMDAAEYKHIVLGLTFLKYISDAFESKHAELTAAAAAGEGADPEDPDEHDRWNGPAGNGAYALTSDDGLTGSTGFAVLRPKRPEFRGYVYLCATATSTSKS